ncbi:MAG: TlpA disulfide reductase family protein [Leeuwenhoekiella sp.]
MKIPNKDKEFRKTLIQYGLLALVIITLYVTGLHTEVIGFAQRGLLATGLMNPDVEQITRERKDVVNGEIKQAIKADLDFDLIDENGKITSLKEMKGKVIFLNYWATWCPPCVAEMPGINTLHKNLSNEVAFVMVAFDEDFETARAFNRSKEYNLPIYAPAGDLPKMFRSSALPTTYVIDAKGNLAMTHKGMADYSDPEFKKFLNNLK